MFIPEKKKKNH